MTAVEQVLGRAGWAARAYQRFTAAEAAAIASAVAATAAANARMLAESAVADSGRGLAADRARTHLACANAARAIGPRRSGSAAEIPHPVGVVLAELPAHLSFAHGCIASLLALATRNAIVVNCPDEAPGAAAGIRLLAAAAAEAGAPDGVVSCVTEPLPTDGWGGLVVTPTTGAAGVPVLVDAAADPAAVAAHLVESVSFDNGLLGCTESVLILPDGVAGPVTAELARRGAAVLDDAAAKRLGRFLVLDGRAVAAAAGRDAAWLAEQAGIRVDPATRMLVAPFDLAVPDEPFVHAMRAPVLGIVRVPDINKGVTAARGVCGRGLAAALHSSDPDVIRRFCTEIPAARIVVNAATTTDLAAAVAAGLTVAGRPAPGLAAEHLVSWTRVAATGTLPELDTPAAPHRGPVPPYPVASNARAGAR